MQFSALSFKFSVLCLNSMWDLRIEEKVVKILKVLGNFHTLFSAKGIHGASDGILDSSWIPFIFSVIFVLLSNTDMRKVMMWNVKSCYSSIIMLLTFWITKDPNIWTSKSPQRKESLRGKGRNVWQVSFLKFFYLHHVIEEVIWGLLVVVSFPRRVRKWNLFSSL